jgi:hypothetical protein
LTTGKEQYPNITLSLRKKRKKYKNVLSGTSIPDTNPPQDTPKCP